MKFNFENEITPEMIVRNFQSMKSPVELNRLLLKFFCYATWFMRDDTGGLAYEAYLSNPTVSRFKGTVMQNEKALINDRLCVSKLS